MGKRYFMLVELFHVSRVNTLSVWLLWDNATLVHILSYNEEKGRKYLFKKGSFLKPVGNECIIFFKG